MSELMSRERWEKINLAAAARKKRTEYQESKGHILLPQEVLVAVTLENEDAEALAATVEALLEVLDDLTDYPLGDMMWFDDDVLSNKMSRLRKAGWVE